MAAACAALDCLVEQMDDLAAGKEFVLMAPQHIVFIDATFGERRVSDLIRVAKAANPDVGILLMARPEQVVAEPALLMLVGYEYLTMPVNTDAVSAEVRLRLDQQRARRVSAALASTLEYDGLLQLVLTTAVQEVGAETASLLVPDEGDGTLRLEAARGLPDEVMAQGHEARDDGIAEWVFEHGEPLILQGGFSDLPFSSVAAAQPIASAMVIPLNVGRRTVAVLSVARIGTADPFTLRELRALEIIATQAAVAVHNAQAHRELLAQQKWEQELQTARVVQQHLLAREFPVVKDLVVQATNIPAHHIGGDFYDVFRLSDTQMGVVVGDVSGKGIPGALLMIQCMNDVRRAVQVGRTPADILSYVNDRVATHSTRGMFVTLMYAVVDTERGVVEYANAGHLPALHVHGDTGAAEFIGRAEEAPLGPLPGVRYDSRSLPFAAGDSLLLFTDGVVEAKNPAGEEFGFERLRGLYDSAGPASDSLLGPVLTSVQAFADSQPQHDDLTLLGVRFARVATA